MKKNTTTLATPYTTPWTLRAYDALPGNPLWIGIGFTIALLGIFFVGRNVFDGADNSTPDDLRVAITQILMTAYSATAYAYLLMSARKTAQELSPIIRHDPQSQAIIDRVAMYPIWLLPLVGALSFLVIGVGVTNLTTPEPVNPWEWQNWNYDVFWHRASGLLFVWWIGCFCQVTVWESARLSLLSAAIESLDILELRPYRPLIRFGLTNALLVIGMVSVMSLLGAESRYVPVLIGFWIMFVVLAWIGMMLPLRGIRKKIKAAKNKELDWCRESLKIARNEMKSGATAHKSVAEILAYKTVIEDVKNWPFDNPTLVRFSLYLLIPLGSWLGGAFVERGLDIFLS